MATTRLMKSCVFLMALMVAGPVAADIFTYDPDTGETTSSPTRHGSGNGLKWTDGNSNNQEKEGVRDGAIGSDQSAFSADGYGIISDAAAGTVLNGSRVAENLSLPNGGTIGGLQWWGAVDGDTSAIDSFVVEIFQDLEGAPGPSLTGSMVVSSRTNTVTITPIDGGPFSASESELIFNPVDLPPGQFWVSVAALTPPEVDSNWIWLNYTGSQGDSRLAVDSFDGEGFAVYSGYGDLSLRVLAPEPASLVLLGMAATALRRRSARR